MTYGSDPALVSLPCADPLETSTLILDAIHTTLDTYSHQLELLDLKLGNKSD